MSAKSFRSGISSAIRDDDSTYLLPRHQNATAAAVTVWFFALPKHAAL